jgi:DNA-binding protein HU-beta
VSRAVPLPKPRGRQVPVLVWGLAMALLVAIGAVGHVQAAVPVAVRVSFRSVTPVEIGNGTTVVVDLRLASGSALANEPVELSLDGAYYRRGRTDASGAVSFPIPNNLVAGSHPLKAVYPGKTNTYLAATATASLAVTPYLLTIQTVPALPGMAFTFDGKRFEAGADGYARISVAKPGDHVLAALDKEYKVSGTTTEFARWSVNNEYSRQVTVSVPKDGPVQAGFDVFRQASQVFVDPSGGLVSADRITSFTLRSSLGQVLTYTDGVQRSYKASRVVRRSSGLESVDVRYNVTDVEVDGSNVVNEGQQHFFATGGAAWRIQLLLYTAKVQAKDAIFGFTAGSAINVIFPDGTSQNYDVGDSGEVVIPWLARGIYRVGVVSPPGFAPSMPVALSRDQQVDLRVISFLDMGVAAAFVLIVVFGLLYRGRPHLIRDSVRGVGTRIGGIRRWAPGADRGADRGAVRNMSSAAASPPPAHPATPRPAPNQEVPKAEAVPERRVDVAPLLATIAPRSALDILNRAPASRGRNLSMDEPISQDLIDLAPSLFGPPEPLDGASPPPDRQASARATTAPELSKQPMAAEKPKPSRPRRTTPAVPAPELSPKRTTTRRAASTAVARATTASNKSTPPKTATRSTTKGASKRAAAGETAARPTTRPRASTATAKRAAVAKAATKGTTRRAASTDGPKSATAKGTASAATAKRATARSTAPAATAKRAGAAKTATSGTTKRTAPTKRASSAKVATSPTAKPRATTKRATGRTARSTAKTAPSVPTSSPQPPTAMAGEGEATQPDEAATQACENCGLELWAGAQFCRRCGQPTAREVTSETKASPEVAEPSAAAKKSRTRKAATGRRPSARGHAATVAGSRARKKA